MMPSFLALYEYRRSGCSPNREARGGHLAQLLGAFRVDVFVSDDQNRIADVLARCAQSVRPISRAKTVRSGRPCDREQAEDEGGDCYSGRHALIKHEATTSARSMITMVILSGQPFSHTRRAVVSAGGLAFQPQTRCRTKV